MDTPTAPLSLGEHIYWRLFVVLGGVGLLYETWVLGNCRMGGRDADALGREMDVRIEDDALHGWRACRSTRLLSDEEVDCITR